MNSSRRRGPHTAQQPSEPPPKPPRAGLGDGSDGCCAECGQRRRELFIDTDDSGEYCAICWEAFYGQPPEPRPKRPRQATLASFISTTSDSNESDVRALIDMGFEARQARTALQQSAHDRAAAVELLLGWAA